VIELPFACAGVHDTAADAFPAVAVTFVGASGVVAGVTGLDDADAGPVPWSFVADTLKVYVMPLERFGTDVEVAGGEPLTIVSGCGAPAMKGVTV
jgi:hypothetical protein